MPAKIFAHLIRAQSTALPVAAIDGNRTGILTKNIHTHRVWPKMKLRNANDDDAGRKQVANWIDWRVNKLRPGCHAPTKRRIHRSTGAGHNQNRKTSSSSGISGQPQALIEREHREHNARPKKRTSILDKKAPKLELKLVTGTGTGKFAISPRNKMAKEIVKEPVKLFTNQLQNYEPSQKTMETDFPSSLVASLLTFEPETSQAFRHSCSKVRSNGAPKIALS